MLSHLRRNSLFVALFAACILTAQALDEASLPEAFLRRLAANEEFIDRADFGDGGGTGGYLLRWRHDLNGDGVEDHFLATTLDSVRRGTEWTVYLTRDTDNYYAARERVFFHQELIHERVVTGKKELTTFVRSDNQNANVIGYTVDDAGQIERSNRELTDFEIEHLDSMGGAALAEFLSLGNNISGNIEKVLLADFLNSDRPTWRPYDMEHGPDQQYLDPEDAETIQRLSGIAVGELLKDFANRPATFSDSSSSLTQRKAFRSQGTLPTEDRDTNPLIALTQSHLKTWQIALISSLAVGALLLFYWRRLKK